MLNRIKRHMELFMFLQIDRFALVDYSAEMKNTVLIEVGRLQADCFLDPTPENRDQQRDPAMHQTKKGNAWHFGMKAHVGVDSETKMIHTVVATAAHVADSTVLPELLHGEETRVWGDQAYRGQTEVIQQVSPKAKDCTHRRYRYKDCVDEPERERNRIKSKVRSRVEHVFGVMKLKFGFVKVRYRGLAKNANRLFATCALVNLYLARPKLLRTTV